MKKIYQVPFTTCIKLTNANSVLTGSALHTDGVNITGKLYDDTPAATDGLGRQNSGWDIWGSEEEYDEDYDY